MVNAKIPINKKFIWLNAYSNKKSNPTEKIVMYNADFTANLYVFLKLIAIKIYININVIINFIWGKVVFLSAKCNIYMIKKSIEEVIGIILYKENQYKNLL